MKQERSRSRWPYSDAGLAASYDRVAVPHLFAKPARDLVAILRLPIGGRALDAGTGTGAAALAAAEAMGPDSLVVGLDRSAEMLGILKGKGMSAVVVGEVPGLPFRSMLFDGVLASFVLSHFSAYPAALADMVRVLRPGGRLGATAWGSSQNEFTQTWKEVAATFYSAKHLDQAFRDVVPWDEWFSKGTRLEEAFKDAELVNVELGRREYAVSIKLTDFLSLREASVEATTLRQNLEKEQWHKFKQQVIDVFVARFKEPIEYTREVHLCVGAKPQ